MGHRAKRNNVFFRDSVFLRIYTWTGEIKIACKRAPEWGIGRKVEIENES